MHKRTWYFHKMRSQNRTQNRPDQRKIEMENKKNFLNKHILFKYPMPLDDCIYLLHTTEWLRLDIHFAAAIRLQVTAVSAVRVCLCVCVSFNSVETTYYYHNFRSLSQFNASFFSFSVE